MRIKKELIIVFFIILFVLFLEIISNKISEQITNKILKEVDEVCEGIYVLKSLDDSGTLNEENKKNVENSLKKLMDLWFDKKKLLALFFEHNEIEKISRCMVIVYEDTKNNSFANALEAKNEMKYLLKYLNNKDELLIENIF